MLALIRESTADYDFVVLDSSLLLYIAERRVLARQVEGVVLVVQGGAPPLANSSSARRHMPSTRAHIVGVVLNNIDVCADDDCSAIIAKTTAAPTVRLQR
jgi:Mrp family chromosome partitioning ATPase